MKNLAMLLAAWAWLFCPVAGMAYQCEEKDLTSTPGWIWKAAEDAGHNVVETYILTFKENGLLLMQEKLPDGTVDEDTTSYRIDGKVLKVVCNIALCKGKEVEMPCNFFNGQLQLTINEETYVFDPKTN